VDWILGVMRECYNRIPHGVEFVDLYIFSDSTLARGFLAREVRAMSISSVGFSGRYFAMHDAWKGTPRIVICLDKMLKLPRLVQVGGIRHEVGHSILHGSIEYYVIPIPQPLRELGRAFNLSISYLTNILYLISVAVKDYEVTRLLHEAGYVDDQMEYIRYILTPSEEEIEGWNLARGNAPAELLYLASQLKCLGCAAPLTSAEKLEKRVTEWMRGSVMHLPKEYGENLLRICLEEFRDFKTDTIENIMRASRAFCELIAVPLMERGCLL